MKYKSEYRNGYKGEYKGEYKGNENINNYKMEKIEIIDFCLKHDLIKKTDYGYIIKREFFEMLDLYDE